MDASPTHSLDDTGPARPDPGLRRLWLGALLPPLAWVGEFLARYALVRVNDVHHTVWPARVATVLAIGLVMAGAALSWREHRRLSRATNGSAGRERDAARTDVRIKMAIWGLALAAYFLLLILAD